MIPMTLKERAAAIIRTEPDLAREIGRQLGNVTPVGITPRQSDLLQFIQAYQADHGSTPSYSEMANGIGVASKSGIHRMVLGLEERGYLVRLPGQGRSVSILGRAA